MNCCDWFGVISLFVLVFGTGHFVLVSYLLYQFNYMPCAQFYYLVGYLAGIIGFTIVGSLAIFGQLTLPCLLLGLRYASQLMKDIWS